MAAAVDTPAVRVDTAAEAGLGATAALEAMVVVAEEGAMGEAMEVTVAGVGEVVVMVVEGAVGAEAVGEAVVEDMEGIEVPALSLCVFNWRI